MCYLRASVLFISFRFFTFFSFLFFLFCFVSFLTILFSFFCVSVFFRFFSLLFSLFSFRFFSFRFFSFLFVFFRFSVYRYPKQCHYLTVSKFICNCYSLSKAKIKFYLWYIIVSQFKKLFIFMFDILYDIVFFRINLSIDPSCGHQITLLFWWPPDNPSNGRHADNSSLLAAAR